MKASMPNETKGITLITYIYLVLPFLIFSIGWFRAYIAVPVAIIVAYCGWKAWREAPSFWCPEINLDSIVKICFIATVLGIWIFYSGVGKLAWQNKDHLYRNAIFQVLVDYKWPVYNWDIIEGIYSKGTATSLIYYIGFWLPAAVVGKLFGLSAGYLFQVVWAWVGVILVYYYLCARKRKLVIWPVVLLIFFSGLDILGVFATGTNIFTISNDSHIEWWVGTYQYSSMTTQLFFVFNQAIPAWLVTIFAMEQKNNRSLIFLLSTLELTSTFPFVGLIPYTAFWMLSRFYELPHREVHRRKRLILWMNSFLKDSLTIQNLLGGGLIGILSFFYLWGNIAATGVASQSVSSIVSHIPWIRYFIFIILEVGIYLALIYKYHKKEAVYYVTAGLLILIPLMKGYSGDFCMRASIPALFVLLLLIHDALEQAYRCRDKLILTALVIALCIGSVTSVHELIRPLRKTIESESNGLSYNETLPLNIILNGGNFSGSTDGNFFFEYIAKEPN